MRATLLFRLLLPVVCLTTTAPIASSQTNLEPGTAIQRRIAADQTHQYAITLQADQFVRIVVDQKAIDLGIRIADEAGRRIGDFDSPNSAGGPEFATFVSEKPGTYEVEIIPLDGFRNHPPGQYEIRIAELRNASDQELRSGRPQLALRSRGVALLNDILLEVPSVRNRLMRVNYETSVAGLLSKFDPKASANLLQRAADTFRQELPQYDDVSEFDIKPILRIRARIVNQMLPGEPEAALVFLRSTRTASVERYAENQDREFELSISRLLAPVNPAAAFQIAKENLKDSFSPGVLDVALALREKNPELASVILHDILSRLANQNLLDIPANAEMASSLAQSIRKSALVSTAARPASLISEPELRGLLQRMASQVLSYTPPPNGVFTLEKLAASQIVAELKQWNGMQVVSPEALASVEQRLSAKASNSDGVIVDFRIPDARENAYLTTYNTVGNSIRKRQFEDAFQDLERLPMESRLGLIGDLVSEIQTGLKKSTAQAFLERIRRAYPFAPRAQDESELEVRMMIIQALSEVDPVRGFEMLEPLLDQFNDLAAAAVTMNGFSELYFRDGELATDRTNAVASMATQLATALGQLTASNFQRAKADADRIRPLSVRIEMHLAIARHAITGEDDDDDED